MNLLQETANEIARAMAITKKMEDGEIPDMYSLLGINSNLIDLYAKLSLKLTNAFRSSQHATLHRKEYAAKAYKQLRERDKKTATDSRELAILAIGEECNSEIESLSEYREYLEIVKPLSEAINHIRQVVSKIEKQENHKPVN